MKAASDQSRERGGAEERKPRVPDGMLGKNDDENNTGDKGLRLFPRYFKIC